MEKLRVVKDNEEPTTVQTFVLDLDDVHILMDAIAMLAHVTNQNMTNGVMLRDVLNNDPENVVTTAEEKEQLEALLSEGVELCGNIVTTGERLQKIHDAMENGQQIEVVAVPF